MEPTSPCADVLIIGGGVIGVAMAYHVARISPHATVVLLEQAPRLLSGASRGNSAMIHTGFDATPGTLEARLVKRGHELFYEWVASRRRNGIATPFRRNGAVMAAWSEQEVKSLLEVEAKANANEVRTVRLTPEELYLMEPCIAHGVLSALSIPGETSVDPWLLPTTYLAEAMRNGRSVTVRTRCRVVSAVRGTNDGGVWTLTTSNKELFRGRVVVNAAGLRGDDVERLRGGAPVPFEVYPRAGRYVCFHTSSSSLVSSMLLPIPTKQTKGIILFPTLYGNVIIGPTAEEPGEKHVHEEVVERLKAAAVKRVPLLAHHAVSWEYAGSRPALVGATDYHIGSSEGGTWCVVAGVRSTGLTSSLAVAEYVWTTLMPPLPPSPSSPWRHVSVEEVPVMANDDVTHPIARYGWPRGKL